VAAVALPAKVVLALAANSRELTVEGKAELRDFVDKLKAAPQRRVLVKGYVSSSTASAENTRLSEKRAEGVRKLLVASGIEARRIEVKGMGIEEPIASNATAEGRTKNRRVEIVVLENGR
jgi:OOP family OmpA-OmpF porin